MTPIISTYGDIYSYGEVDTQPSTAAVVEAYSYGDIFSYGDIKPSSTTYTQTDKGTNHLSVCVKTEDSATSISRSTFSSEDTSNCIIYEFEPHSTKDTGESSFYKSFVSFDTSNSNQLLTFTSNDSSSSSNIAAIFSSDNGVISLKSKFQQLDKATQSNQKTFTTTDKGLSKSRNTHKISDLCVYSNKARFLSSDTGKTNGVFTHLSQDIAVCRLPKRGIGCYVAYLGIDSEPDLTTPWQTFINTPFTTPQLPYGHTYNIVVRKINEFGISSLNTVSESFTPGNPNIKPSAPTNIILSNGFNGSVNVTADYDHKIDGAYAADEFLIYIRNDGTPPDTSIDIPFTSKIVRFTSISKLSWDSIAFEESTNIVVLVRSRRNGIGGCDSINTTTQTKTTTKIGPSGLKGSITESSSTGNSAGFL